MLPLIVRMGGKRPNRLLKNQCRVVSQGARIWASAAYAIVCEHCRRPRNAGSRTERPFFNSLLKDAKGESDALYNCCNTGSVVVAGYGDRIHGWIFYSHPAGRCCRRGAAQSNSREEIRIVQQSGKRGLRTTTNGTKLAHPISGKRQSGNAALHD
jgi:hypothetical protein